MIGKQILNYKIESLLGKGGMGTVYLGKHLQMERKVAIKMLHPDLSSNESLRERFRNEASALAHLQNPYIVTLYDYYESEEGLFLIMEYIKGMELADHINKVSGPIDEKNAIHYFTQILDGFKYAHKKKVVHRDIKPSNILITPDDEIKIMDFGIAKIVDSEKSLTKTGTQIGTVFYMSPEQVKGEKIDYRSDIYSLGVTLFQMITGQCPYNNDTTEFQIYNNIVNDPLPDPASIYPGVSEHLAQVIAKATQKNVEDRFQSCEEFKKALNDTAFKTDLKVSAVTEPSKTQVKEPAKTEAPKTKIKEPSPSSTTPPKKKKNTAIIIAVILALVIGGGYYLKENTDLFGEKEEKSSNNEANTITENLGDYDDYEEAAAEEREAQSESDRQLINNWVEIKVAKSYFYDYPDYNSKSKSLIVLGDLAYCTNVSGNFLKVTFYRKGKKTETWILKNDIDIEKSNISFYMVNVAAYKNKKEADEHLDKLKNNEGYKKAGFLWIPHFKSLSGNEYYAVYIGPFTTQYDCELAVEKYRETEPSAYGLIVDQESRRIKITGIGKVKISSNKSDSDYSEDEIETIMEGTACGGDACGGEDCGGECGEDCGGDCGDDACGGDEGCGGECGEGCGGDK